MSKRWWLAIFVVLGVVLLVGWNMRKSEAPAQVITSPVARADLEDAVLASGVIEAVKQVSVGAQVSGQIKRLYVSLGETVSQGQLIAEIDATPQTNNLRNAQAQVMSLQAQLAVKQANLLQNQLAFDRQQTMMKAEATSQAELEAAKAALDVAKADLKALKAQLDQSQIAVDTARVNLSYTRIVAPMAGVVVAVIAEEGRTVNANQSAPTIIKLANLDTVQIKAQVSEADVVRVKPGTPVYFTILGEPDKRYNATLRAIEPAPESEQTDSITSTSSSTAAVYYNALFNVPNPDHKLRIAMTAQVFVVLEKVEQALVVSSTALGDRLPEKNGAQRYKVRVQEGQGEDKRMVDREVTVGLNNRVQAQVLSGLKEGDEVVVGEAASDAKGSGSNRKPRLF